MVLVESKTVKMCLCLPDNRVCNENLSEFRKEAFGSSFMANLGGRRVRWL